MGRMRGTAVAATDERVGLMMEIISNIRTIKLNCLEYHFRNRISAARRYQLSENNCCRKWYLSFAFRKFLGLSWTLPEQETATEYW